MRLVHVRPSVMPEACFQRGAGAFRSRPGERLSLD